MKAKKTNHENTYHNAIEKILISNGYVGGWEGKLIRGETFNPNIMELGQMAILSQKKAYGYHPRDVGLHSKGLDGFIVEQKYLCLVWVSAQKLLVVNMSIAPEDIFKKSIKMGLLAQHKSVEIYPFQI